MFTMFFDIEDPNDVNGYSMGHIGIEGDKNTINSKTKNQSMMIFISIVELLDGLKTFLRSNNKTFEFVGADSSFIFFFKKKYNGIEISNNNKEITTINKEDLVLCILEAIKDFLDKFLPKLSQNDVVYSDLINSFRSFSELSRK